MLIVVVVVLGFIDITTLLVVDVVDAPGLCPICLKNALLTQQNVRAKALNFCDGAVSKHHQHEFLPGFHDGICLLQVVPELIVAQIVVECNRPKAGGDD